MGNKSGGLRHTAVLIKNFFPYFKPYWRLFALDFFCAALTTVCDIVLPLIVRFITNTGMSDLASLTIELILKLGVIYFILRIFDTAAYFFMQSTGHMAGARIETDMRHNLFAKLELLPHSFYDNTKLGQLMSRITTDLNDITEFAHHFPEELFITTIKLVAVFMILCFTNIPLTLIVFVTIPLMIYFSNFFSKRMHESFSRSRHQLGEVNSQAEDSLSGIRVVKSFANESLEMKKFDGGNRRFLSIKRDMYFNMAGFHSVTRLFDGLMYIVVVIVGAIFMIRGSINAADLMAYLLYVTTLIESIRRLVEFSKMFQRGITGIERFEEIMRLPVEIEDLPDAKDIGLAKGEICFDHVSFSYEEGSENILTDINLTVKPGDNVAIVGPSGGGKTTLVNLIPRFYEPQSGRIMLDGNDIRGLTLASLRRNIGMVQQDVYMFSGTVMDNILYGRPGASREDAINAAKLADAHDFIMSLENGYETHVGERGVKLSGGQKQRISIARVFLKNPPVLILDEATSSLDNESEHLIQQSLEQLMKGRTTFTIAHRLTTIRNASLILVLTHDGIAEQGTHEELLKLGGIYASMYRMYKDM